MKGVRDQIQNPVSSEVRVRFPPRVLKALQLCKLLILLELVIGLPPVTCKLALVSQLGLFLSAYFIILNDPVNLLIGFNLSMEDHSFLSILITSLVITYLISLIGITLGKSLKD